MLKKIFLFFLFIGFLAVACGAGYLYWQVVLEPGSEIKSANIDSILGKESPVFYNDNQTQLGVFFDKAHRQYVKFSEIPPSFVNALVAAEDNRFFSHFGFDIFGITRAAIRNIEAGRVVQGGSTLTQQTAKNLFKRTDRSFKAKFKELLYALKLEYHYTKEEIFEFYANQFYVSGNGHGLGVAARYYFDKEPKELSLIECAFIAGSVKRPNYYNPFIKKTREDAELAKERARTRLKYVLDKMLELEMIGFGKYREALASNLDFKQGKVGYSLDYIMEMVKDAVSNEEVTTALSRHGVDNVATSGIRVVTTIDKDMQAKTLYALRHDLSRLDVMLNGYERDEVQQRYQGIEYRGDGKLNQGAFLFGEVESIAERNNEFYATVNFGRKTGSGVIDRNGFERLAAARVKWQKNLWTEAKKKDSHALFQQLQVGDQVWVSVREIAEHGEVLLELEKFPEVQGGAMVLADGLILAMAGGVENRFYNRAVYAKRTMGSSFKPFLYTAALQLGWNSSDQLRNTRDVFVFQGQPYFPRPDHKSPYEYVSMSWAGVHSENLASIWLLEHLLDKVTPEQFREVAEFIGLTPRVVDGETEPYRTYRTRIRDRFGIAVTRDTLKSGAYRQAVNNSEADFMFENRVGDYRFFRTLRYGLHFDRFMEQLTLDDAKLSASERKEKKFRKGLLEMNFLRLESLRKNLDGMRSRVEDPLGTFEPNLIDAREEGIYLYRNRINGEYSYLPAANAESYQDWISVSRLKEEMVDMLPWERQEFWNNVKLFGQVSVAGFDMLANQLDREYKKLQRHQPYSFKVLASMPDFRVYVGLRYLIALADSMGVRSKMEPVLSFPLGANVTTLLETTRMYETMVTGMLTTYGSSSNTSENDNLLVIDRIESEEGKILYRPEKHRRAVVGKQDRVELGHILENTIKFGTGRKADAQVRLRDESDEESEVNQLNLAVPLLGKTGTANRYTNASFYGFLPGLQEGSEGLTTNRGYAVGVYVGYDDNDPMRKGSIRITGSSGALPTWIDVVNELVARDGYGTRLDPVELTFSGLQIERGDKGQQNFAIDKENGGLLAHPLVKVSDANRYTPSILTYGQASAEGEFIAGRSYQPFWKVGAATE